MSKNLIDISRTQADQLVQQAEFSRGLLNKMEQHEQKMNHFENEMNRFGNEMTEKENKLDSRFEDLEKNLTLTHGECKFIKSKVAEKSYVLTNKFFDEEVSNELYHKKRCHFITGIYSSLNKKFNAITYTTIKHIYFDEAMSFVQTLTLDDLPKNYKRLTDSQIDTATRHGDYGILERLA